MIAGNAYVKNLDFSGETQRGMEIEKTESMVVDLKKNEVYRRVGASQVAGVAVAGCETAMALG